MKLAVGSDEIKPVVNFILSLLGKWGHTVTYYGPKENETLPWPTVAEKVARAVVKGEVDEGVLMCWTGTGVCIAANKVKGIRAALVDDAETARGARLWNNANLICLSLRKTTDALAEEILTAWFTATYKPNPVDDACLKLVTELEQVA